MDNPRTSRAYRGADGRVISGEEAERLAEEEADRKAQETAKGRERWKSRASPAEFRLEPPTAVPAGAPISPAKRKPKG